jgi:hypothetical protein
MYGQEKCIAFAHMTNDQLLKRMKRGERGGETGVVAHVGGRRKKGIDKGGAQGTVTVRHHKGAVKVAGDVYKEKLEQEEQLLKQERVELRKQKMRLQRMKQQRSSGKGVQVPTRLAGMAQMRSGAAVNPELEQEFEKYGAIHCPPGRYNKAVTCEPCEAGKYQQRFAYVAPAGWGKKKYKRVSADTQGKKSFCTECPGGKFQTKKGATACRDCEIGQYRGNHESGRHADGVGSDRRVEGTRCVLYCTRMQSV